MINHWQARVVGNRRPKQARTYCPRISQMLPVPVLYTVTYCRAGADGVNFTRSP